MEKNRTLNVVVVFVLVAAAALWIFEGEDAVPLAVGLLASAIALRVLRRLAVKAMTPLTLAIAAIMIAITAVFTLLVRIPIPATQGYVNFSDVATFFSAFAFGPVTGFVAGGVGAAIADLLGGYPQFAILSLLAHGLQGLAAGALGRGRGLPGLILAWLAGAIVMVTVYLLGEGLVLTGWGPALAELPFNALQTVVGGLIGIPLVQAIRKAYPPIARLNESTAWREE
ncbi:MAG: ECF transporter S component [Anaerolineae bacterium]